MALPVCRLFILLALLVGGRGRATGLNAQTGIAPATPSRPAEPTKALGQEASRPIVVLQSYDEASSRLAFSAIDRDADDRLSIFEFAAAQDEDAPANPQDSALFRRVDTDRDGFLNWPEFDARMQSAIRLGGEFRYRPARAALAPTRAPSTLKDESTTEEVAAQARALLTLLDTDRSDTLSRDEFSTLLASANMPASDLTHFVHADRDGDKQLDETELITLAQRLPDLPRGPRVPASGTGFSVTWRRADGDGDGEVSTAELEAVLRSLEIHLGRWAGKIVADADRTGDQRIGPAEVLASEKAAAPGSEPRKESNAGPGARR